MAERTYSVEEANAITAHLREVLKRIREAREIVVASAERVHGRAAGNGGGPEGAAYWEAVRTLRRELEGLAGEDVILRDAESGLVDFPSRREGRQVYLCWRPEEPEVAYWHEVNSGFGGRRPVKGS